MEKEEWKERVKRLERRVERKERGERRNNIIVKKMREGEGDMKGMERVWKKLGMEVKVESIREIKGGGGSRGSMWLRVGSKEEKRRIMQSKWKLKGEEVRIEEDLTWEERRIKWRIRQCAMREEEKGKRVRMRHRGIWVEGKWWE